MASVYTDLGPGDVVETKTVRGRTSYRVAGHDGSFDVWFDGTKLGFAEVDHSNSVDLPYNPTPQYGVGALTDSTIQPIHEIDPDKRLHPADSQSFDSRSESEAGDEPGPASHLFAAGIGIQMPNHGGMEADPHDAYPPGHPFAEHYEDEHGPAYSTGPEGNSIYGQPAEDWSHDLHGHGEDWGQDEPIPDAYPDYQDLHHGYRQADVLEGAPQRFEPNFIVNDTDDEFLHNQDVEEDERESTGPDDIVHFAGRNHPMQRNAWAVAAPAIARGVGQAMAGGAVQDVMNGGGGQDPQGGPDAPPSGMDTVQDAMGQFDEQHPLPIPGIEGTGWGDLTTKHGHNLGDRYADIITHDPHSIVAQFQNDPDGVINRIGHAESEGLNPRFAQYGELVDADEVLRTAAWKDVREKAKRLRMEGRVHVKDVGDDRIYASVQGDHGTYDVMIKKGGAFGGFGGGHAVSNWHCGCEWGKWAFQRRFTFIGRLCSHGLASYHEMQSQHLKGVSQKRKRVNPRNARVASDQTPEDWTIDGPVPTNELSKLRGWAEQPHDTWNGNQADHVDDVQDAVERAREEGVDASQLVASLQLHEAGFFRQADGYNGVNTEELVNRDRKTQDSRSSTGDTMAEGVREDTTPVVDRQNARDGGGAPTGTYTNGDGRAVSPDGKPISGTPADNAAEDGVEYSPGAEGATGNRASGGVPAVTPGTDYTKAPSASGGAPADKPSGASFFNGDGGGSQAPQSPATQGNQPGGAQAAPAGGGSTPGVGDAADGVKGDAISQGDYKINSGDTLSDIAQRAGYGDNYQSLGDANGISNYDQINAGDTIKIGDPAGGGAAGQTPAPTGTPGAGQQPTPAPTADAAAGAAPAATPAAPVALDAVSGGGSGSGGGGVDTGAAATPPAGNGTPDSATTPDMSSDTGGGATGGGADSANMMGNFSDAMSTGMDAMNSVGDALKSFTGSLSLEADRDWVEAAYPDGTADHKPFNGSGGIQVTEWGTSKDNVKENYSEGLEDVTDVPNKTYLKETAPLKEMREGRAQGITRAGQGPRRQAVEPVVVRERRPRSAATVEAHVPDYADFDPLAPRTAASFDDPYRQAEAEQQAVLAAANSGPRDIVAQFQASGGGAVFAAAAEEPGGQFDDFSESPAFRQAMQRTAGRNFTLAEQEALIREGDRGGAGNLNSLDLSNTHYEAMNSVGLW